MSFLDQASRLISNFLDRPPSGKPKIVVLLGATASGKTALSIDLAQAFKGEVISADSRQVYRYMDIGTDKILLEKKLSIEEPYKIDGLFHKGIRHHLIDVVNPDERFTVADFKEKSEKSITEIIARGNLPFVVGGTGLYIRALTENFSIPKENPEIRKRLYKELEAYGAKSLHLRLEKIDPASAKKIHFNNHPYVIRALEIFELTGKAKSQLTSDPLYDVLKIGLHWPREIMFERINIRAHEQIYKNGLIEETQSLLARGYNQSLSSMSSLGYREIMGYLHNEFTLEKAEEFLKQNTRNFAKRQLTWFSKEQKVIWLEGKINLT